MVDVCAWRGRAREVGARARARERAMLRESDADGLSSWLSAVWWCEKRESIVNDYR